ncbi:hypothetical protein HerbRD11066_72810 [Herbidospora sp. RD11066]
MSISATHGLFTLSDHEGVLHLTPAEPGDHRIRWYLPDINHGEHAIVTFPGDPAKKFVHRG